jgi:endogenous inhibitor of DNA gyrase (YacG/DUF329 family)
MKCPICKKSVEESEPNRSGWFPFCSQRCKLIDLGRWLDGKYQIADRDDDAEDWVDDPNPARQESSSDDR